MPFKPADREALMVAAARRCCVCHRYKGVGVEVHHIIPEASGGSNSIDNGIVLCFDCHAAAGHYNPKHPRGTKFSPSELAAHKKNWLEYVSNNREKLEVSETDSSLTVRYLLANDRLYAKKIFDIDRDSIVKFTYLLHSKPINSKFYRLFNIYASSRPDHETDGYYTEFYKSRSELYHEFPELTGKKNSSLVQSLVEKGVVKDHFANELLSIGVPPSNVGIVEIFSEECGGSGWGLDVRTRKPYFVFSDIRNIGKSPVTIDSINMSESDLANILPSATDTYSITDEYLPMGNITLDPGENLIVFLGILAGPIDFDPTSFSYFEGEVFRGESDDDGDTIERLSYTLDGAAEDFCKIGGFKTIDLVTYSDASNSGIASVHKFDPKVLFFLSREWMIGSCPHIYGVSSEGCYSYIGALFEGVPDCIPSEQLVDVGEYENLIIAEIENEVSHIELVRLDGETRVMNKTLFYGNSIFVSCKDASQLWIRGWYSAKSRIANTEEKRRQKAGKRVSFERELASNTLGRMVQPGPSLV